MNRSIIAIAFVILVSGGDLSVIRSMSAREQSVPAEFKHIDFKNFVYPISRYMASAAAISKRSVKLRDGKAEFPARPGGGGTTYDLRDVTYIDLNDDGRKEAIVRLSQVACGGSCDGGTEIFYFYSSRHQDPILLTRLEIGSNAYECGLKSFVLKDRKLLLETFRACRFTGSRFSLDYHNSGDRGKFMTVLSTKFTFHFTGARFIQDRRRVVSYKEPLDYRADQPKIEIGK